MAAVKRRNHEHLEKRELAHAGHCRAGADCQYCRARAHEYLCQRNDTPCDPGNGPGYRQSGLYRGASGGGLFCLQGVGQGLSGLDGAVLTLLYAYVIYAFAAHFNHLFLVYVAILGLSFYTFLSGMLGLQPDRLQPHFVAVTKARVVSVYLLLVAVLFALLWLSQDIPAIVAGNAPQSVTESGLLTNPVHVLDLGLYLPAMIITALLLWRRKFLGYILAIPLLVFSILTGIGILAIDVVTGMRGMPMSPGVDLFLGAIIVVSLVLGVLYVQEVN